MRDVEKGSEIRLLGGSGSAGTSTTAREAETATTARPGGIHRSILRAGYAAQQSCGNVEAGKMRMGEGRKKA
jgi:hypothetical protein